MSRRTTALPLLLAVCLAATNAAAHAADAPLRVLPPAQSDERNVGLTADRGAVWAEGDLRVIALEGDVSIRGADHYSAARAVAWVDVATHRKSGLTKLTVYAEEVRVGERSAPSAILEFDTRGELSVNTRKTKFLRESLASTDFYQLAARAVADAVVKPPIIQQTADLTPAIPTNSGPRDESSPRVEPRPLPPEPEPTGPSLRLPEPRTSNASPEQPGELPPPLDPTPNAEPVPPAVLPEGPPADLRGPGRMPRGIEELPLPAPTPSRIIEYAPRFASAPYQLKFLTLPSGEQAAVITGGIILTVRFPGGEVIDLEADRVVAWTKGGSTQELFGGPNRIGGAQDKRQIEFYLSGNVEFRYQPKPPLVAVPNAQPKPQLKVLRAERVYYDVSRNKALAINGDLQIQSPGLPDVAHIKGAEIQQLSPEQYEVYDADIFSSKLPSNPGLKLHVNHATVVEEEFRDRGVLGIPQYDENGQPLMQKRRTFTARNTFLEVVDVPVFYVPYLRGDVNDPLGPFQGFAFRQDNVFGTQVMTTWDLFQLIGLDPRPGRRARLFLDYLSERGPAGGGQFDYFGSEFFGFDSTYYGLVKGYGVYDQGYDRIGGARENEFVPPDGRGRVLARHVQDYNYWHYQGQISYLSDHNFLEQYYKFEFDLDQNQETFAHLKWQRENLALVGLIEPNLDRYWVNETQWLPRGDAQWLGISFFDMFTYNLRASAGYAATVIPTTPANSPVEYPPQLEATDVKIDTSRVNLNQELTLPFQAGPFKIAPYGIVDLTHYSQALDGEQQGRFYGAGGVRANLPLSRLYPDVTSELFNLKGINHKIAFGVNYYNAYTDVAYSELPQLDRVNDDATDQSVRDIRPNEAVYLNTVVGALLQDSPLYNPQVYAIRRLVDNRVDTLDTIQVLQGSIRQRWQTKRGFPGSEHIVDYMWLDLSASFFPDPNRDNFGEPVSFLEYAGAWNIGDRTTLFSSGWVDPFEYGARFFSFGSQFTRPDGTSFYLGYRQIDPLESRAVTGSISYLFSTKYAVTAVASYDFGTQNAQQTSLIVSRTGTDVRVAIGVNYDAIIQNFGVTFEVVPNIIATTARSAGGLLAGAQR